jgi:hypothetical protein
MSSCKAVRAAAMGEVTADWDDQARNEAADYPISEPDADLLCDRCSRKASELGHGGVRGALTCRVADLDWRLGRVYFLALSNPSRGQPDPALTTRLASLCHGR